MRWPAAQPLSVSFLGWRRGDHPQHQGCGRRMPSRGRWLMVRKLIRFGMAGLFSVGIGAIAPLALAADPTPMREGTGDKPAEQAQSDQEKAATKADQAKSSADDATKSASDKASSAADTA